LAFLGNQPKVSTELACFNHLHTVITRRVRNGIAAGFSKTFHVLRSSMLNSRTAISAARKADLILTPFIYVLEYFCFPSTLASRQMSVASFALIPLKNTQSHEIEGTLVSVTAAGADGPGKNDLGFKMLRNSRARVMVASAVAVGAVATTSACGKNDAWIGAVDGSPSTSTWTGWRIKTQLAIGDEITCGPDGLQMVITKGADGKTKSYLKDQPEKPTIITGSGSAVNWMWVPIKNGDRTAFIISEGGNKDNVGQLIARGYVDRPGYPVLDKAHCTPAKNDKSFVYNLSVHGELHDDEHAGQLNAIGEAKSVPEQKLAFEEEHVAADLARIETLTIQYANATTNNTLGPGRYRVDGNGVLEQGRKSHYWPW
jgi:hypothetical protein